MKKKLKVYLIIPPVADCGVGYYRMWLPLMTAAKKGLVELRCQHFTWGERNDENGKPMPELTDADLYKHGEWADVIFMARNDVPHYIAKAGACIEFFNKPVLIDIDDNVQATRPYNPGYRSFHPNSSCNVFNIKSMGIFSHIVVSTKNLKDFYSDYTEKEKISIYPNSLEMNERDAIYKLDFSNSKLFNKDRGIIRIGWTGSASHWENIKHIEPVIINILKKYPNTEFVYTGLFGDLFQDKELIEQGRIKQVAWAGLKNWAKFNREVNFDIALAPLADNMFNRAKSNLRVLEYGSARFPVICSPVEPYKCFKDKKEVLFATEKEEWQENIEKLINDPKLRKELSQNLYKRVKKDFDVNKNYKILYDILAGTVKRFKK